ncbi:MFS transporter [Sphingorhabdus soli]|uniref:MFS transporter n=1 Tax=Flavisphingopyxis soli TaxID=2601267 RepID=A0A5C6UNL5_9SPHN|nr:MFS transporter [Sphingorhabdus soli]TXC73701.1 MFS transporter [Sphingorhabdus soli]
MTTPASSSPIGSAVHGRRLVLAMLLVVYTFNFLDRQILSILAGPIQADLGFSDTQMGLLGGSAFALLYAILGIPFALVADRTSRSWTIAISLGVWSGFTALCGFVTGFWQMFLARVGVGVGEAGGVAPSYALIADYFPPQSRARALAVYSLGIPLGSAAGVLFGARIAAAFDWRTAFIGLGLAGLIVAIPFKFLVKDRARQSPLPLAGGAGGGQKLEAAPSQPTPNPSRRREGDIISVFATLARKKSFWLLSLGAGSSSLCGYGLAFWLPSLMQRSFGLDLVATGQFIGGILLIGGVAGVLAGGWLGDRLGGGDRAMYARVPAIAFVIAVPLFAAAFLSSSPATAFAFAVVPQALAYIWLAPVITAIQHLVPAEQRATASASFLFINNAIGLGLGTLVLGALSDAMTASYGAEALRYAMLAALGFYLIAALLMALGATALRKDWVEG